MRRGWTLILVAWLDQAPLPLGRFVPAPWPAVLVPEEAPQPCRGWRCPRPLEAAGGRRDQGRHGGKNMGIMTTLKKPTAERRVWRGASQLTRLTCYLRNPLRIYCTQY